MAARDVSELGTVEKKGYVDMHSMAANNQNIQSKTPHKKAFLLLFTCIHCIRYLKMRSVKNAFCVQWI